MSPAPACLNRTQKAALRMAAILAVVGIAALAWLDPAGNRFVSIFSACAAAAIVAGVLRGIAALTPEASRDFHRSTHQSLRDAVDQARRRVHVLMTWIPTERDRLRIANSRAEEIRVMLSSSRPEGHLRSRISTRLDGISPEDAQQRIAGTARVFLANPDRVQLRFNHGHLPGWIVIADDRVYWGPFPAQEDCFAEEWWCHWDDSAGDWGRFWIGQFDWLWLKSAKDCHEERNFNLYLPP